VLTRGLLILGTAQVLELLVDVDQCLVVIDGAGTLPRQTASVYAAGGSRRVRTAGEGNTGRCDDQQENGCVR
jgi:hypothetical protein